MTYSLLSSAPSLAGKRVLLRAGFDLPIDDGSITDTTRIQAIVPTMRYILDQGAILILLAHQGRPKDAPDPAFSQRPLVTPLSDILHTTVHFATDCIGPDAVSAVAMAKPGEVVLLENLRFHAGEKKNDPVFAKALSELGDVYVNDAFTNCHRNHASMTTLATLLPSYMGFSLEKEVAFLSMITEHPRTPLTLIVAGSKMETKVPVIEAFLPKGDHILVGGCIANTFIAAEGHELGTSKYDPLEVPIAMSLLQKSRGPGMAAIHVPTDACVSSSLEDDVVSCVSAHSIPHHQAMFDLGTETTEHYVSLIRSSKMIVWNGPVGVYEKESFSRHSRVIAEAIQDATASGALSIIGGGDTIDFHLQYGIPLTGYSFVSMGGGAMLEYIAGHPFPSLDVLRRS